MTCAYFGGVYSYGMRAPYSSYLVTQVAYCSATRAVTPYRAVPIGNGPGRSVDGLAHSAHTTLTVPAALAGYQPHRVLIASTRRSPRPPSAPGPGTTCNGGRGL